MIFHLLSDLHADQNHFDITQCYKPEYKDNCLILAGDIADPTSDEYHDIVEFTSKNYKYVFVIKGNHECYGHTVKRTDYLISKVCELFTNVFYLNKNTQDIDDNIRVLGTTLWSNIDDDQKSDARMFISDFRCIREWTIEQNNHEHKKDVKYILNEIDKAKKEEKSLLVITHHAPHLVGTSRPEHDGSPLSSVFATDLSHLFVDPIKAWVFGHTHHSVNKYVNDIKLVANQRGLSYENNLTGFDPYFNFII